MKPVKAMPRTHMKAHLAARRLGISRRTLSRLIARGDIEAFVHSHNLVTVSVESIIDYERRARVFAA